MVQSQMSGVYHYKMVHTMNDPQCSETLLQKSPPKNIKTIENVCSVTLVISGVYRVSVMMRMYHYKMVHPNAKHIHA